MPDGSIKPEEPAAKQLNTKIYVIITAVIVIALITFAVFLAHQQKQKKPAKEAPSGGVFDNFDSQANVRNANRKADIQTILNAVYQYSIDNQGNLPSGIASTPTDICATGATNCTGLADLSVLTNNGTYLVKIPEDPLTGTAIDTHYQISQDSDGRITVIAPDAENGQSISSTR